MLAGAAHAQNTNSTSRLPDVLVQGAQEEETTFVVTNATTALKMDVPLLEIPQAVSIVPRSVLNEQGVRRLEDALRNVSGVVSGPISQVSEGATNKRSFSAKSTWDPSLR